jgi:hypothetical protein
MRYCVCGHPEEALLFGGRCRVPGCVCDRFWPIPEISDGGAGLPELRSLVLRQEVRPGVGWDAARTRASSPEISVLKRSH